jgi:hypothetical protein
MRHPRSLLMPTLTIATAIVAACTQQGGATTTPTTAPQPTTAAQPTMALMGTGMFHDVDGTASGEAQLIVTPDGVYEVVLEQFNIASIEHTNLVLVSNGDVTSSSDVDKSKLLDLGPLKATSGMQDFPIPADMAGSVMESYHTVVIWDTEMAHAIAAAPLQ